MERIKWRREVVKLKIRNFSNIFFIAASFIIIIAIFLLGTFLFLDIYYSSKFFPNIKVAGVKLDGKTKDEARDLLTSKVQEWSEQKIIIRGENKNWEIANKDLGVDFDIEKTIEEAFTEGRKDGFQNQLIKRIKTIFLGVEESLNHSDGKFDEVAKNISNEANVSGLNVGLKIENGQVKTTEEKAGKRVDTAALKYLILDHTSYLSSTEITLPLNIVFPNSDIEEINKTKAEVEEILKEKVTIKAKDRKWQISEKEIQSWIEIKSLEKETAESQKNYSIKVYLNKLLESFNAIDFLNKGLEVKLQKEKVSDYLSKNIASAINRKPKNAGLGIQNEKVVVVTASQNGEELDIDNSIDRILNALKKKDSTVTLLTNIIKPDVREDNLDKLGIVELIGRGQSDASGSSSSRRHNIQVGSSKINGVLVAPGEEFSLNKYLVPVDATNGFEPELVIKPGKLVKEYGGGLCQVATTAFRAALYAGVPITERKNHAFAVHYYDWPFSGPGVDATIYPPHPDLRFKNDTGKYILIQTSVSGNRLTYDLYGTKGGRRSEIENPQYVERNSNGSSKTVFYRNVYKDDKLTRRDTFYSFYKPAGEFPREGN